VLGRFGVPWEVYHGVHVDGTRNVLRACEGRRLERFVLCSSPGMLGTLAPGEPPRDESAEHRPVGFYERSKSEAENAALSLAVELDIPLVIARPEFVYGPGDRHVLGLFRAVQGGRFFYIGSGDCLCHPSYIDDVVAGLMACATGRASPQQAYHICGPRPLPLREFVGAIADALGVKAPRLHLPKPLVTAGAWAAEIAAGALGIEPPLTREGIRFFTGSRAFCTDKGRRDLGWSPRVDPVEGVQRAVDWYRAQGWL
jgi:dihydroflavonol-4-reductase